MLERKTSRITDEKLVELFSLGNLYISDFIDDYSSGGERVPLTMTLDKKSGLLQLKHTASFDKMYQNYWYRSGINKTMTEELKGIAKKSMSLIKCETSDIVLDIGCNDGTLLKYYRYYLQRFGFDPAKNMEEYSREYTNWLVIDYFTAQAYFSRTTKKAKIITAIAMFYDLEEPHKFVDDIDTVLDDEGLWIVQMSYMPLMLQQHAFDNCCHEHLEYYALASFEYLIKQHNLKVVDVELNDINGGSFRIYVRKSSSNDELFATAPYRDVAEFRINSLREYEKSLNLNNPETYTSWFEEIQAIRKQTVDFIKSEKAKDKTIWGYGACYDSETRVVTKDGIKRWEQLTLCDTVFTLNVASKQIEEKPIKDIMFFDYNGELIHFFGKRNDLMVTPNHKMLYENYKGGIKLCTASVIKDKNRFKLPSGTWIGNHKNRIKISDFINQRTFSRKANRIPSRMQTKDLLYLLGLYVGDGYCCTRDGGYSVNFCIPIKDKARRPLEDVLSKYNIQYRHYDTEVQVASKALVSIFSTCGTSALTKTIPNWALEYDSRYLKSLLTGLIDSDGWYEPTGRRKYRTSSEALVRCLVELCVKLGYKPTIGVSKPNNTTKIRGRIINSQVSYTVNIGTSGSECYQNELVQYSGKVWCLSVDNENFLVERNGKFAFCGNSTKGNTLLQWYGLDNILIDAIAERNPQKYGKRTVGTNIEIKSEDEMRQAKPDYLLVLPWHFIAEFKNREKEYLDSGGKFIVPLPHFKVIGG